ncbi:MAG: 5'-nucleotidase C-terminal domain-containing protein, partial [Bacteroidota bacterium]
VVSANEGDSRDYDGFSEEERVGGITLDPTAFPNAAELQQDSVLGRLNITTTLGDTDGDGDFDELYSYGARSFSIWAADGSLIFDSGNHMETKIAELDPDNFNSNNDDNDSRKARSDDKGPEPEAVEIVKLGDDVFALIGLERMSGIMVYDITDPTAPTFVNYVNNRDFGFDADTPEAGDLGVEDLKYISAEDSPVGIPLVLSANEVSGTVTIFAVNEVPMIADEFTLRVVHNNDGESRLLPDTLGNRIIGGASQFKTVADELRGFNTPSITLSSGDNFLAGINFSASLNRAEGLPFYDAQVLDAIGYDAIAIGNHDFDFGPDVLADFIQDFSTTMPPYLSANLDFSGEANLQALVDEGRIAPRTIINVDGEQIGVVGLITESINNISSPGNVVVDFNLVGVAQAQIDSLEAAGVNKIILITHLQDIDNEIDLISQIEGVDVVIAGGGDELLTNNSANILNDDDEIFDSYPLRTPDINGDTVYVVTTPGNYRYVGNLVLSFDEMGNVTSVGTESDLILVENAATDAALDTTVIDSILANQLALRSNIIAQSEVDLDGIRGNVRTIETNQGNLITDAFLWLAERDRDAAGLDENTPIVAIQGGGGIRNDNIIPAGPISEAQTFDMLPFANSVQVLDPITPAEFKTMLENSVSKIPGASGRFLQVAGFEMVYDTARAAQTTNEQQEVVTFDGERVVSATLADGTQIIVDGEVVDGAPNVYVVTNSFTARGGDEYYIFDGRNTTFIAPSYQRALFEYIVDELAGLITAAQYPVGGEDRIVLFDPTSTEEFDLDLSEYSFNVSPNPMSNNVQVSYELPKTSQVTITLVDLMGRPIQNIVEDQLGAGQYTHTLDGSDLPTGIYAFLIQIDGKINAMKVVKQ